MKKTTSRALFTGQTVSLCVRSSGQTSACRGTIKNKRSCYRWQTNIFIYPNFQTESTCFANGST